MTIDEEVMKAISAGARHASDVQAKVNAARGPGSTRHDFRTIDRALQRLRRSGQIVYGKKKDGGIGWTLPSEGNEHG